MLVSAVLTLSVGHVTLLRFQLHFTCQRYLLWIEVLVRTFCDSAVDFTGKKVVSVVVILKIEVARDFYVTKQRISTSWGVCRLLGCSRRAPSAALATVNVADGCFHRRAESNLRFVPVAQTQMFFHFTQTFPEKLLGRLQSCPAQKLRST